MTDWNLDDLDLLDQLLANAGSDALAARRPRARPGSRPPSSDRRRLVVRCARTRARHRLPRLRSLADPRLAGAPASVRRFRDLAARDARRTTPRLACRLLG